MKVRDEKYIPWKWEPTTAKEVMLMLDKMEFMPKGCKKKKKRQRKSLFINKVVDPTRTYNIGKYLYTHVGAPTYIKQI